MLSFLPLAFRGVLAGSGATAPPMLAAAQARAKARPSIDERSVLLMPRRLFGAEHEKWRAEFRRFLMREVVPKYGQWERQGCCDAAVIKKMAVEGFYLRFMIPKQCAGPDFVLIRRRVKISFIPCLRPDTAVWESTTGSSMSYWLKKSRR